MRADTYNSEYVVISSDAIEDVLDMAHDGGRQAEDGGRLDERGANSSLCL